jgi:hypothetical protein
MAFKSPFTIFLIAITHSAAAQSDRTQREYIKSSTDVFQVINGDDYRKLRLPIYITDWRIDCSESRAVIWGHPKKATTMGSSPYARVYIVSLPKPKILASFSTTRGPYDAEFSVDKRKIIIDEIFIDFKTGKLLNELPTENLALDMEECTDFHGKHLLP